MKIISIILGTIICLLASYQISNAQRYEPYSYEWEKKVDLSTHDRTIMISRNLPHVIRMKNLIEEVGTDLDTQVRMDDERAYKRGMIIYYAVVDEYARKLEQKLDPGTIYDLTEIILKNRGDIEFQKLLSVLGDSEKCMSDQELKMSIKVRLIGEVK